MPPLNFRSRESSYKKADKHLIIAVQIWLPEECEQQQRRQQQQQQHQPERQRQQWQTARQNVGFIQKLRPSVKKSVGANSASEKVCQMKSQGSAKKRKQRLK